MTDKNQAVIDFLITNPDIRDSPLYFNFINAQDNDKQVITQSNDRIYARPYIDGSVPKQYTFILLCFKSISDMPLVTIEGYSNENIIDLDDVQLLMDWVNEQNELQNFPDFGEDCMITDMQTTTENPVLEGINTEIVPNLAMYSVSIRINYIDLSKKIWRD